MRYVLYSCGEQPLSKHILQIERHSFHKDVIGCVQRDIVVWFNKSYGQWFWSEKDIKNIQKDGRKLLQKKKGRASLQETHGAIAAYWDIVEVLLSAIGKGSQQLDLLYEKYVAALRKVYAYFITTTGQSTFALESTLKSLLKSKCMDDAEKIYSLLVTPEKQDILNQELIAWKNLFIDPSEDSILEHTRRYSILLPHTYSKAEALEWARKRLQGKTKEEITKEIECSEKRRERLMKEQKEILRKINSDEVEYLSSMIKESALIRLMTKACWNGEAYHLLPFFELLANRARLPVRDIYLLYAPTEILSLLRDGTAVPDEEMRKRKQCYLLIFKDQEIRMYSGKEAIREKQKILDPSMPSTEIKEFSGMVANTGIKRGKVLLVKTDDPSRFSDVARNCNKDTIIVTGMTNPAMMVLLRNIGGIITDEGGMACHAAIISREFSIPCIVGCKIATLVLRGGETVELDATTGTVKRLDKL